MAWSSPENPEFRIRQRKGLAPLDVAVDYAGYKAQQFDILASAMREHIDIKKIYQIMQEHQEVGA